MGAHTTIPPPTQCETLVRMIDRFGGTLERLPAREPVRYELPSRATPELVRYFASVPTVVDEPDFIARLPDGRVYGAGTVISPDGGSVARDVSTDFGSPPDRHWLQTQDRLRAPVRVAGTTAAVAVNLGARYCHWLLEELPRLLVLAEADRPTLIAHAGVPFIRDAFALGAWGGRVLAAGRHIHFECEHLVVPGLIGRPGIPTLRMAELLQAFAAPLLHRSAAAGAGERLYITREGAERRCVANEAELWPRLEARGFVKVRLESLPWVEQVNAFARAREIVAPHGAGLANLVFCHPGVRVVEFFNPAYVNPCFWRLAALRELDYRPVATPEAEPPTCVPRGNRLDIVADAEAILRALDRD